MILNYIWVGFFLVAFAVALLKLLWLGDTAVFPALVESTFTASKTGFELSLYLTGVMTLWLGLMKIGEKSGVIALFSRVVNPFFAKLFSGIPPNHPASGSILMNFSANMLGLDNAAMPLGLKAMQELQEINPNKDTASDAQIMFVALNTSGLTIIPLSIILDRSILGAANPADIFIPTLIATCFSSFTALIVVSLIQKINLLSGVVLAYLIGMLALVGSGVYYFAGLPQAELAAQSRLISSLFIMGVIMAFLTLGLVRKVPLFETFVEGAKEGFTAAVKVIPYLVGILVAIGVFRASGALDYVVRVMAWGAAAAGLDTEFVKAMPVALLKPLSGGAAKGMMVETVQTYGVDSFAGRLASVLRGCTETTFYTLAIYFGSVGVQRTRYALWAGLAADTAGIAAAIWVSYLFFS